MANYRVVFQQFISGGYFLLKVSEVSCTIAFLSFEMEGRLTTLK